jgi:hypothetical protein
MPASFSGTLFAGALDPSCCVITGLLRDRGQDARLELPVVRRQVEVALGCAEVAKARVVTRRQEVFQVDRVPNETIEVVGKHSGYAPFADVL